MDHPGAGVTEHAPQPAPHAVRRLRCGCLAALALATVALAAPLGALAADPPTILTAGIDAGDRLYATWRVAPGTTFDQAALATVPDPDPSDPTFFAGDNTAGFCIYPPDDGCTATSYGGENRVTRDRRYFVMVSARVGSTQSDLSSAVWVIDDTKPLVPGDAPIGSMRPSNMPVAGHVLGSIPPPPVVVPPPTAASIKLLAAPKRIGSLMRKGVRLRVTCAAACDLDAAMGTGRKSLGRRRTVLRAGMRIVTLKLNNAGRKQLRHASRAEMIINAQVSSPGGATQTLFRFFTVRR
jgi:hypothetical protein